MTIKELYEKLNSPGFQDTENGDMYYNLFVYQYPPELEYDIRKQIQEFKANLIRPTNYVDVLALNLFEEFCAFLDQRKLMKQPMLKYLLDKEKNSPETSNKVQETLSRNAESPEFIQFLHKRILEHISIEDEYKRPYVFFYGVGLMYPYLRVSQLLTIYEDYNDTSKYKILIFYPGHREGNSYRLFGELPDKNPYRAHILINE